MSTPCQKIHAQKLVFDALLENKEAYNTALHHLIGPDELGNLLAENNNWRMLKQLDVIADGAISEKLADLTARNKVLEDALRIILSDDYEHLDEARALARETLETPAKVKGATP